MRPRAREVPALLVVLLNGHRADSVRIARARENRSRTPCSRGEIRTDGPRYKECLGSEVEGSRKRAAFASGTRTIGMRLVLRQKAIISAASEMSQRPCSMSKITNSGSGKHGSDPGSKQLGHYLTIDMSPLFSL